MVAETGLKWQDNGEPALLQVSIMYKVPALLLVLLLSLYPLVLHAQSTKASITGRVTDPSKAVIGEAKVAAVNLGTNFRYETTTNGAGEYTLGESAAGNVPHRIGKVRIQEAHPAGRDPARAGCAGDRFRDGGWFGLG